MSRRRNARKKDFRTPRYARRGRVVAAVMLLAFGALAARAVYLQVLNAGELQAYGKKHHQREVTVPAARGVLSDRNGTALAVSTPVDSVSAVPGELAQAPQSWPALCKQLGISRQTLRRELEAHRGRGCMYLKRHLPPAAAAPVRALGVRGVHLRREYRRYYPAGAAAAHVVGLTDVDMRGIDGMELALEETLRGEDGKKVVLLDSRRNRVDEWVRKGVRGGGDVRLSLDSRLQRIAHRELAKAARRHRAAGGSAVVVDAQSGEVLALTNVPSFNPNNRKGVTHRHLRNRAVIDVFEPGSAIKPFTIAAALESGAASPGDRVQTSPGWLRIGGKTLRDPRDFGELTLGGVVAESSNVGIVKIAQKLPPRALQDLFAALGFGAPPAIGLPGESAGVLPRGGGLRPIERASLSYGYGLSVTALQLARAYTAIANDGIMAPLTVMHRPGGASGRPGQRVFTAATARAVRAMMEQAAAAAGTAAQARIAHYRVAAKTGTVKKFMDGAYAAGRYTAVTAGLAPASRPRLVMVAVLDDPRGEKYYGGEVAAPVFQKVMTRALRMLNIPPDGIGAPARGRT